MKTKYAFIFMFTLEESMFYLTQNGFTDELAQAAQFTSMADAYDFIRKTDFHQYKEHELGWSLDLRSEPVRPVSLVLLNREDMTVSYGG